MLEVDTNKEQAKHKVALPDWLPLLDLLALPQFACLTQCLTIKWTQLEQQFIEKLHVIFTL